MGRNGNRSPWDEDPMGCNGTVGMGSYETETPWGATGTDPHGMKTPWGTVAQWGRDPMRPRPYRVRGHGRDGTPWDQDPKWCNGDTSPWGEDPMGHSGIVGMGSYETETP